MKIDWKRKLTSRKFWAAIASFVAMLLVYFGKGAGTAEQVAALIMAGASVIAYIIGEGIADNGTQIIEGIPIVEGDEDDKVE